ncbi:MAG TPA: hypothetical protein VHX59_21855 [Mycobacteriales bacterium]|nr:hypothetical protein [Mycobacteriales bacterium]
MAWKSTDGTTRAGVVTFHKLSDSASKVMVQLDWMPNGIVEKVGAAIGVDDCRVKADLRKFKQLIEAKGEAGGWRGEVPR